MVFSCTLPCIFFFYYIKDVYTYIVIQFTLTNIETYRNIEAIRPLSLYIIQKYK